MIFGGVGGIPIVVGCIGGIDCADYCKVNGFFKETVHVHQVTSIDQMHDMGILFVLLVGGVTKRYAVFYELLNDPACGAGVRAQNAAKFQGYVFIGHLFLSFLYDFFSCLFALSRCVHPTGRLNPDFLYQGFRNFVPINMVIKNIIR